MNAFKILEDGTLVFEDAQMIFRDFSGRESKYNRDRKRSFAIVIDDEQVADDLIQLGWNVKELKRRDEDEPMRWRLSVRLDMTKARPPKVMRVTRHSQVQLSTNEEIETLDGDDILDISAVVRPYRYEDRDTGEMRNSAWLKELWVRVDDNIFADKYRTYQNA